MHCGDEQIADSMTHSIVVASADSRQFAHDLSRDNMAAYRARGSWDSSVFDASWPETENFEIHEEGMRIGVVRIAPDVDALYVSDLQILPGHQNRGGGSFALRHVERLAVERALGHVRLRAFTYSRAAKLYRRLGFLPIARDGAKLLLEKRIEPPEK
jgi:GNAT superfamily N-acetyltransferase